MRRTGSRGAPDRAIAAAAIAVLVLLPRHVVQSGPLLCPFRRLTGRPCPACGLTRSWNAALRLHPAESLAFHPLGMVTLAAAAAFAAGMHERWPASLGSLGSRPGGALLVAGWLAAWGLRLRAEPRRGPGGAAGRRRCG